MPSKRRISQLGEFGFLKKLLPRLYWPSSLNSELWIGPGDDAGALRISPGKVLVATTDTLVEGVHFERRWSSPRDLGEKLLAVNLSDLAAMGEVTPLAALLTVALPGDTPVDTVDNFYKGLRSCAQRWKIGFLGGDTVGSKRDWVLSATVLGEANPRHLIQRSGARKGDILGLIGSVGLATAGLEVLQQGKPPRWTRPLVDAFSRPVPQLLASARLARQGWVTSMIDASDGLEASARLLADASMLGVEIDLDQIPVPAELHQWAAGSKKSWKEYVLRGGEDYALVFTVPARLWPVVQRSLKGVRKIGRMLARKEGRWARLGEKKFSLTSYGYTHF
jgi:thiamine-monophosphate kinase